jgi:hypothetical protein
LREALGLLTCLWGIIVEYFLSERLLGVEGVVGVVGSETLKPGQLICIYNRQQKLPESAVA